MRRARVPQRNGFSSCITASQAKIRHAENAIMARHSIGSSSSASPRLVSSPSSSAPEPAVLWGGRPSIATPGRHNVPRQRLEFGTCPGCGEKVSVAVKENDYAWLLGDRYESTCARCGAVLAWRFKD